MRLWVGITDSDWYRFLSQRPGLDEANFWQPSGNRVFRTLSPGEPFLFKLHAPENYIVGGGFFTHSTLLPCSRAWEAFGEKNGTRSFPEMRQRIERYRRAAAQPHEDYRIGCIVLQSLFFFDRIDWIPVADDFSRHIVQGKSYDTASPTGGALWDRVKLWLEGRHRVGEVAAERPMYGEPTLVRRRLGQGSFQVLVTDVYERRCAVTREKTLPALETAHILPVSQGGVHRVDNGLLLRSDIHSLFDRGYVTITPDRRFRVSRRLKAEFDNGDIYYERDGQEIWVPPRPDDQPSRLLLEQHGDQVFRG